MIRHRAESELLEKQDSGEKRAQVAFNEKAIQKRELRNLESLFFAKHEPCIDTSVVIDDGQPSLRFLQTAAQKKKVVALAENNNNDNKKVVYI